MLRALLLAGMAAGLSDLHPHTPTTPTTSSHLTTLTNITHGTLAITTVTCRNAAGLQATFSSDGVTILQTPPTNDSAYLAVSSPLLTVYPSRDSHVASRNVTLHWGGFTEPAGTPLRYEVCLGDSGECVMVGTDKKLTLDGVGVASFDEEDVSVTAINLAGLRSSPLRGQVVFQTNPPMDNGKHKLVCTCQSIPCCDVWQVLKLMPHGSMARCILIGRTSSPPRPL